MPCSDPTFDEELELYFRKVAHESVVDVGAGKGKYGTMIRRVSPATRLIAVEVEPSYVDRFRLRELYDEVRVQDAAALMDDPGQAFSAVLIGDCLEHMRKSAGTDLIHFLVYRCRMVIVKFPVGFTQNALGGHSSEAHVSVWSEHDFAAFDHLFAGQSFMRLCFIRGYLCEASEWLPIDLVGRFGLTDPESLYGLEGASAKGEATDPRSGAHRWASFSTTSRGVHSRSALASDLAELIPPGESYVFVDQNQLYGAALIPARRLPFLERGGEYWGTPPDDTTAIRELERLRRAGASFVVFAWPTFWWFEYYTGFCRHLAASFPLLLANERVKVFDLRAGTLP